MVNAPARIATPETVRSMGAYPSFSIESMYSPRGIRASVNGEVPNSRRADVVAAAPCPNRFT